MGKDMESLSKIKLSDMVAKALVNFIMENNLRAGDKLPTEKKISERLGIGRTSVREGIRRLDAVGLLETHQGDGIYLRDVTIDSLFQLQTQAPLSHFLVLSEREITDLLSVRLIIESAACRLAIQRITDEEIGNLRRLCKDMEDTLQQPEMYMEHDLEFHRQLIDASGNVILPKIFALIRDLYSKQFSISAYPKALEDALRFHREILSGIEQRDEKKTLLHLEAHLKEVKRLVHSKLHEEPQ
jgi:GntR family transcriptional repressor for pyruvate dehydrogenase complex